MNPLLAILTGGVLFNIFRKRESIPAPINKLSSAEVRKIIVSETLSDAYIHLTDSEYNVFKHTDYVGFIAGDTTNLKTYVKNDWDCENFSFLFYAMIEQSLKGCPCGIVFLSKPEGNHACNFFIDEKGLFWLVEPQDDRVFAKPADWSIYFALV